MTCGGVMNGGGSPTTDSETVMVATVGKREGRSPYMYTTGYSPVRPVVCGQNTKK